MIVMIVMYSDDKLKEINIENYTCCYLDDITKIEGLNLNKILRDGRQDQVSHKCKKWYYICNFPYVISLLEKPIFRIKIKITTTYNIFFRKSFKWIT